MNTIIYYQNIMLIQKKFKRLFFYILLNKMTENTIKYNDFQCVTNNSNLIKGL
jgi:hypothetical protein